MNAFERNLVMAYIENKVANEKGNPVLLHLLLVLLSGLTLVGGMYFFTGEKEPDISSIMVVVLIIGVLTIFVSKRLNPMAWKKLINKKEFNEIMSQEKKVNDKLLELDDSYFVFCNFVFELFYIDHLVVSENGIFILARVPSAEELNVKNKNLFAGDTSLETITGRLWRVSHLLNIIIRTGFNGLEVMPVPILVAPDEYKVAINEFNGIAITNLNDLKSLITNKLRFKIQKEQAEGFAVYLKERYM